MEALRATKRTVFGKKVKTLRRGGLLPAVIYGKSIKSLPVSVDLRTFQQVYENFGESSLVDLAIEGGDTKKVLITDVDTDPVTDEVLHANFYQVDLKEEVTTEIPIEIIGEAPVVTSGEGIVLSLLSEVEVTCLPQELLSEIKVDISGLEKIDDAIFVKDLPIDQNKIKINTELDEMVLKIGYAQMEEDEEETVKEEELLSEVEVEKEKLEEEDKEADKKEADGKKEG